MTHAEDQLAFFFPVDTHCYLLLRIVCQYIRPYTSPVWSLLCTHRILCLFTTFDCFNAPFFKYIVSVLSLNVAL